MSGFNDNITNAQGSLVENSIHSPNYTPGASGWTINQDGSAEFSNLTVRGTFYGTDFILNNQGLFFYSGTPANGNLILSIAPNAGTDQFGNPFRAFINIYKGSTVMNIIVDPTNQVPAINLLSGAGSESQFASLYEIVGNMGQINEEINYWIKGPASSYDNNAVAICLVSSAKDGSSAYGGEFLAAGNVIAEWMGDGFHLLKPLFGWNGVLNIGDNLSMAPGKGIVGRDANWVGVGMASGWSNRGGNYPPFQVMRVAVSPGICWMRGYVQSSGSVANGVNFASFGAAYIPALVQSLPIWVWGGTAVLNNTAHIEVTVGGAVNLWGIGTAGTVAIGFSGLIFLDAL